MKLGQVVDRKLLKFIAVGIVNTLVGVAIMFGLYNLAGYSYWISSAANYVMTSVLSYFLNKHFTFQHKGRGWKPMLKFTLSIAVCYLLAYGIAKPSVLLLLAAYPKNWQENAAMLVGMVLFTGFNYLGQRFFAFREIKKDNEKQEREK